MQVRTAFRKVVVLAAVSVTIQVAAPAAADDPTVSTAAARTDVSLTIYNDDLSLVRERRSIPVSDGVFRLRYEDVTSRIDPTTVHVEGDVHILEQNYEYDLISRQSLLEKYVGREVGYRTPDGTLGRATLLSTHQGNVFRLGQQVVFELPGTLVLDTLPPELSARPTLVWTLRGQRRGDRKVDVAYLSGGLSWRADYVLLLDDSEKQGALTGWVTLDNQSGAAFDNAQLKLVAGDVNRVRDMMVRAPRPQQVMALEGAPQFQEEGFFEYHLYTLQRRTNVKNNQKKQILFFDSDAVRVSKGYTFRGNPRYVTRGFVPPQGSEHVDVTLQFANTEANKLGVPIPQGIVRVYKRDRDGAPQFLGENRVRHTPKDETLEFEVGRAFDVVGEHKQVDYRRLADRVYEVAFEVRLRNHKEEDIQVRVLETFHGDWKIVDSSLPHKKTDATTAEFALAIPADGEAALTYRVRIGN